MCILILLPQSAWTRFQIIMVTFYVVPNSIIIQPLINAFQDVVASFSTCGGVGDSQNLTPKHSTIIATIDSQSSLYGTGMLI